jgi:hypothetical protein
VVDTQDSAHPLIKRTHQDLCTLEEYPVKGATIYARIVISGNKKAGLMLFIIKHQLGSGVQCYKKVYAIERILLFIRIL